MPTVDLKPLTPEAAAALGAVIVPPKRRGNLKSPRKREPQSRATGPCIHLGEPTGEVFPPKDGLGDLFEAGLKKLHVTKEGWAAAKAYAAEMVGREIDKEASCSSCERKHKWLNHFGQKLRIGKKSEEARRLLQLEEGKSLPVFSCAIHGRCIIAKAIRGLDGAPHACQGCRERDCGPIVVELSEPPHVGLPPAV